MSKSDLTTPVSHIAGSRPLTDPVLPLTDPAAPFPENPEAVEPQTGLGFESLPGIMRAYSVVAVPVVTDDTCEPDPN